jgi:hypothetical protein
MKELKILNININVGKDTQVDLQKIFVVAAKENRWGDPDSISGMGSNFFQTRIIREAIPAIISQYNIKTFLDAPCGDLFWMKYVIDDNLSDLDQYTGADIVNDIVIANTLKFSNAKVKFIQINLITDNIPKSDLILTRDCFIHLSFKNIFRILKNYKKSKSKYILISTYTQKDRINRDIDDTRLNFRALNMQNFPFSFIQPMLIINEGCTEMGGNYSDKSLALWETNQLNLRRIFINIKIYKLKFQWERITRKIAKVIKLI